MLNVATSVLLLASINIPVFGATLTVTVPGTSDPWLAGMVAGSRASLSDAAPAQSPVQVIGAPLVPGAALVFSASGLVSNGTCGAPYCPIFGPDGGVKPDEFPLFHNTGAENGLSDLGSPINALVGVFLDESVPALTPAPARLDFNVLKSQEYVSLTPLLKQPFFIGDGLATNNVAQQIIVPLGATRLFLGTMDGCCWIDNQGSFTVEISQIPEPSARLLFAIGILFLTGYRCVQGKWWTHQG